MDRSNGDQKRQGTMVSVRGSVVVAQFPHQLPPMHTELRAGAGEEVVIEVIAHLDSHRVQGIALTRTQGLARGAPVVSTGQPLRVPVGERVLGRVFNVLGQAIERPVPGSLAGITPRVQDLLVRIEAWREGRGIEQILLFYNTPVHGAAYRATALQLLPVDLSWLQKLEKREWPSRGLPTYTLEWDVLFAALIREYFFASLYRAFAESLASENASRLSSMQAAEKNIEDRLDHLNAQYHHLRQSSITEELLDVVAGYEVLTANQDASGE